MSSTKPPAASSPRSTREPGKSAKSAKSAKSGGPVTWVRDLLQRPLKIERRGAELHVVLGDKPASKAALAPAPGSGETLRRGHEELRALLRRHPETRHLMRHLGFIEKSMARSGSRALKSEVPVPVLRKGIEQLDLLIRGEPSEALSQLRSRIEAAIHSRDAAGRATDAPFRHAGVQVSEASHSLFDEMERSWTGRLPPSDDKPGDRG